MHNVAPNLTALIGIRVAGQMVGAAGSILALSRIPANNLQVLGRVTKDAAGYSKNPTCRSPLELRFGAEHVRSEYRAKALRLLAAKVAIAAHASISKGKPGWGHGTGPSE